MHPTTLLNENQLIQLAQNPCLDAVLRRQIADELSKRGCTLPEHNSTEHTSGHPQWVFPGWHKAVLLTLPILFLLVFALSKRLVTERSRPALVLLCILFPPAGLGIIPAYYRMLGHRKAIRVYWLYFNLGYALWILLFVFAGSQMR